MSMGAITAFWAVSMLFVLTPGADWAFAMAAGIRRGGVFWAVSGMLAGHLLTALSVAAGLAALLAALPAAMTVLTVAGGLYLGWLGIATLRHRRNAAPAGPSAPAMPPRQFLTGVGVSLLNPKVSLLFLALLPQFVTAGTGLPAHLQLLALGLLHVGNCAIVYYAVGYGAGTVLATRPRAAQVVTTITGIVLVGLGCALFVEQLTSHLT